MTDATPDLALWTEWLTLTAIPQVGHRRLWDLVATLGSPRDVLAASPRALREVPGVDEVTVKSIMDHRDALDLRGEAEALAELGGRLVTFLDSDYPRLLRSLDDPPPVLQVLGTIEPMDEVSVAVVGSRNITDYGRQMAELIATGLAEAGVAVVSGFATGVDGVAHTAAVDAGGRTLAVLGCGLDITYPASHRRLRGRVRESGALITTHRMGTAPRAEHFPARNALIAGLAQAAVVIEAGEKSGALITAHHAMEQGRPVFAVPGDATRANSRGVNRLIQEGAKLTMSAEDILIDLRGLLRNLLAELGADSALGADPDGSDPPPPSAQVLESLTPGERDLFSRIQTGPLQMDNLARNLPPEARATLPMQLVTLQLHGLIEELPGKRYAACPTAAALSLGDRGPQNSEQSEVS